jgi:adenylate cyclase
MVKPLHDKRTKSTLRLAGQDVDVDWRGPFFANRFEDARNMFLRSLQEHTTWVLTHRFLASCYAHMGRLDEAREIVKKLRGMTAIVVPSATHWRKPEHRGSS